MKLPVLKLTYSPKHPLLSSGWLHLALLPVFWCCLISVTLAQEKQWDKTLGGSEDDVLSAMIPTPDGGFLLGGSSTSGMGGDKSEDPKGCLSSYCTSDYWVVKLDGQGKIQWDKTIGGGSNDEVYEGTWGNDYLTALCLAPDGGFLLGGYSDSFISGDKTEAKLDRPFARDYWIVKLDVHGNKQWDKAFGGDSHIRG